MRNQSEWNLNRVERRRLENAQARGHLDARCENNERLIQAYGLWCWRLRIPMVWTERQSARSRYSRMQLEMFTTANRLTSAGQAEIGALLVSGGSEAELSAVSPQDAGAIKLPSREIGELARRVYRAATKLGNVELNRPTLRSIRRGRPEIYLLSTEESRAVSA